MDNKKILLVNLSKGLTGELNSKLLGMIFVMKFQVAAMSRSDIPDQNDRVDFSLYVDEFQNFSTDSFADVMSEARKFRLNLIVANQFTTQLSEEIRGAVFGNVGTIIAFRVGQDDTEPLKQYFQPSFDSDDLLRLATGDTIVRTLVNGVPSAPFSMTCLLPQGNPNAQLGDALKQLSAAKYGRPRAVVDQEIRDRLKTFIVQEPTRPSDIFQQKSPLSQTTAPSNATNKPISPKSGADSFLDQWLQKRNKTTKSVEDVELSNRSGSSGLDNRPALSPNGLDLEKNDIVSNQELHINLDEPTSNNDEVFHIKKD